MSLDTIILTLLAQIETQPKVRPVLSVIAARAKGYGNFTRQQTTHALYRLTQAGTIVQQNKYYYISASGNAATDAE